MTPVTWRSALAWRMARHGLVDRPFADALAAARALCGRHAQVASSAALTAFVRGAGSAAASSASASAGTSSASASAGASAPSPSAAGLVKTWAVRGTLHLLPEDELPLWHAAFSTYGHFLKGAWVRSFGFGSPEDVEALIAAVGEALDGRVLTRGELAAEIPEHREKLLESWGVCLKPAAFRGLLVFAEPDGQTVRFTRPVVGERPPVEEAVRAVTRRYLAAYAPARREDLSRWWGSNALSPAQAQKRFEALGDEAVVVDVDGSRCWVLATDLEEMAAFEPAGVARLVPQFDQFVVNANRDVEPLLPAAMKDRVYRKAGWISAVVLVDGVMAGVWKHERAGSRVVVEVTPFSRLSAPVRSQVEEDAGRLADHLGGSLDLRWASAAG